MVAHSVCGMTMLSESKVATEANSVNRNDLRFCASAASAAPAVVVDIYGKMSEIMHIIFCVLTSWEVSYLILDDSGCSSFLKNHFRRANKVKENWLSSLENMLSSGTESSKTGSTL